MNRNENNQPQQLFNDHEVQLWIAVYSAAVVSEDGYTGPHIRSSDVADTAVLHLRERTLDMRREQAAAKVRARSASRDFGGY